MKIKLMFEITMMQRLKNKYGNEIGEKKYWEWRKKQLINNKGINNPNYKNGAHMRKTI